MTQLNTPDKIETIAQQIQGMYFQNGATVNKESWNATLGLLTQLHTQHREAISTAKREALREVREITEKLEATSIVQRSEQMSSAEQRYFYKGYTQAKYDLITHLESELTV